MGAITIGAEIMTEIIQKIRISDDVMENNSKTRFSVTVIGKSIRYFSVIVNKMDFVSVYMPECSVF